MTLTVEVTLIIGLVSAIIAVATFIAGRGSAARRSGEEKGAFQTGVKHLCEKVDKIAAALENESRERREGDAGVHKRLDDLHAMLLKYFSKNSNK